MARVHLPSTKRARSALAIAVSAAALAATGAGVAVADATAPPSNGTAVGQGINEYGMTAANIDGKQVAFTYNKGFFCDTSVSSAASTGCEAGATFNTPPAKNFDPLFITVPLGFDVPMKECPTNLVCVDHPGTIDLSRLEPALKGLYPHLTDAQLTAALKNYVTPGHDHYIGTTNQGMPEWWDVVVVGVTDKTTYEAIKAHHSLSYIRYLQASGNKHVTGNIPTNTFLFFGVK